MLDQKTILAQRQAVIATALGWIGTPYHPKAKVKGAGADCITFIAGAFEEAGIIAPVEMPFYHHDWHLHRSEEKYLVGLLSYCVEIDGDPLPGDIVLWRFGRCFSHGAIVIDWPEIIHCTVGQPCRRDDALRNTALHVIGERTADRGKLRPRRLFRFKGWAA